MTALDRIAADIAARTGWTGKQLEEAVMAAGYLMAAMTQNDAAAAHFSRRYDEVAGR